MNHPLPQASAKSSMAYEFVKAITEEQADPAYENTQGKAPVERHSIALAEPVAEQAAEDMTMAIDPNDAYEAYRQRILSYHAEQDDAARRSMPQPAARALPPSEIAKLRQRDYYYDPSQYYARSIEQQPPEKREPEPFFRTTVLNRGLAIAAAAAVVAGCGLGIALTKKDDIRNTATRTLAYVGAMLPADQPAQTVPANVAPPTPGATVIAKKPIATASLDVADVVGAPNSSIPLSLKADPALGDKDISIRISGLPENAMLTAGQRQDDRTWLLSDDDLANVSLVVPEASPTRFDLSVAAIETKTGELASPVREMTVALTEAVPAPSSPAPTVPQSIQPAVSQQLQVVAETVPATTEPVQVTPQTLSIAPASAAPELQGAAIKPLASQATPVPAPIAITAPVISAEAQALLQKGDVLLRTGDLVMARQFYLRAVDLGAPQGALGVAKTYDPAVFKELNVQGIMPDATQAVQWYRKASAAGLTDAIQALGRFETTAALPQQ